MRMGLEVQTGIAHTGVVGFLEAGRPGPTVAIRADMGTMLLEKCEAEARLRGFPRVELMSTLPGIRLYAARGYTGIEQVRYEVSPML